MAAQMKRLEREILAEFDSQFKEVRNRLNDQLKCLESRQESQQKLLEDFQEYCKQRAEAEQEYGKRCEKIYDTFTKRQSQHRVQRDWAGEAGIPSPVQCWSMLLDNLRSQSKQHQTLSQMYSINFANNLAGTREGLENVHRKSREMTITVHEDLIRQLNELYSAIKSYHNSHRDSKDAEQKKTQIEAERQRLEDKNKKIDKRLEKQLDRACDKFHDAELKATKGRNDYIAILGAVNASLQKYFEKDVTNIIDCLDLGYIRLLRRNLLAQQTAEQQVLKMKGEELQRMEMRTRNMNANTDKELFIEANRNAFTLPEVFDFHPHYGDRTHEMTAPHSFLPDMEEAYVRFSSRTQSLQLEVDEIQKSMKEVGRGWDDDESNNPTADEVMVHFQKLRQLVSSPSVSGNLNRVPSVRRAGKNLQQDTELYYLAKYNEYLKKSNHLARTKSKRDLLKTSLGYDKEGSDGVHHRRRMPANEKTMSRRPVSIVKAKLFGGDLLTYVNASRRDIPLVVERCVEFITLYGLTHQGIFRMPGSQQDILDMQEAFEKGKDVLYEIGPKGDINLVASLLKRYFRILPHPLFPIAMFEQFIECTRSKQGQERIPEVEVLVKQLPKPIMIVMRYLFQFLKTLSQHSDETYMDSRNLATCLGPTLMRANNEMDELTYASNINEVIETMILFQEEIFPKAEANETEYSFISITEGKDNGLKDIDEETSDLNGVANSDYESTEPDHLSFKKGDGLILHKQIEGNLWQASLGEQRGLVKDGYMDYKRKASADGSNTPQTPLSPVPPVSPISPAPLDSPVAQADSPVAPARYVSPVAPLSALPDVVAGQDSGGIDRTQYLMMNLQDPPRSPGLSRASTFKPRSTTPPGSPGLRRSPTVFRKGDKLPPPEVKAKPAKRPGPGRPRITPRPGPGSGSASPSAAGGRGSGFRFGTR